MLLGWGSFQFFAYWDKKKINNKKTLQWNYLYSFFFLHICMAGIRKQFFVKLFCKKPTQVRKLQTKNGIAIKKIHPDVVYRQILGIHSTTLPNIWTEPVAILTNIFCLSLFFHLKKTEENRLANIDNSTSNTNNEFHCPDISWRDSFPHPFWIIYIERKENCNTMKDKC